MIVYFRTRLRAVTSVFSDATCCAVMESFSSSVLLQRSASLPRHMMTHQGGPQPVELTGMRETGTLLQDRNQYTTTVENEAGDRIKVSKVWQIQNSTFNLWDTNDYEPDT